MHCNPITSDEFYSQRLGCSRVLGVEHHDSQDSDWVSCGDDCHGRLDVECDGDARRRRARHGKGRRLWAAWRWQNRRAGRRQSLCHAGRQSLWHETRRVQAWTFWPLGRPACRLRQVHMGWPRGLLLEVDTRGPCLGVRRRLRTGMGRRLGLAPPRAVLAGRAAIPLSATGQRTSPAFWCRRVAVGACGASPQQSFKATL